MTLFFLNFGMNEWTDGRMDGWMDGWTDGWMLMHCSMCYILKSLCKILKFQHGLQSVSHEHFRKLEHFLGFGGKILYCGGCLSLSF